MPPRLLACAILLSPTPALAQTASLKDAADSLFQAKDYDRAIPAYQRVLADKSLPSDIRASAQVRIARSNLFKGDSTEARKAYLALAEAFPDQPGLCSESLLHAGSLSAQAKDHDSAIAHYAQAVERYAKSTDYARLRAAEAQTRLGSVYLSRRVGGKRDLGQAVAAFEQVERLFPDQKEWVAESRMQLVALKLEYAITETAAIAAANAALTAAGVTTDIGDPTASEDQITEPPTRAGHSWTVIRPRTFTQAPYAAVPYRDQQATVIMQAETGEAHAMGVTFDSQPPTSAAGSVTSTQAAATALAVLTAAGITGMTADTPVKTAVRPNTWWQTNGTMDPLPGPAKVAWVCPYHNDVEFHEVWVDIATGDVIGGESATVRGRRQAKTIRGLGGFAEVWTGSWRKEGVRWSTASCARCLL